MTETDLQRKIKEDLRQRFPGSKVTKFHGNQYVEPGIPDIHGSLAPSGKYIVIETKIKNNKPEPIQQYRLEEYAKSGAIAFWCNSFQDYLQKIKALKL